MRLSTWMPYESARELLEDVLGVQVSRATARRATLHTGQAALAEWEGQVERLKQEAPQAPAGAERQAMSGDGAMVHLVGGEWAEVKTLALGEVTRNRRGEVCTQQLSYCSRLGDVASFEHATLLETHRRGLERASEVCAVQDGAEWLQGLADYHRADAVRILDAGACRRVYQRHRAGGAGSKRQIGCALVSRCAASAQAPGTNTGAPTPEVVGSALSQPTHAGEIDLLTETGSAYAVSNVPGSGLAHWLRQRGKCEQTRRRSTSQRGRHAASVGTTSILCWCCVMRSAIASGSRPGRPRKHIATRCAPSVAKQRASNG